MSLFTNSILLASVSSSLGLITYKTYKYLIKSKREREYDRLLKWYLNDDISKSIIDVEYRIPQSYSSGYDLRYIDDEYDSFRVINISENE